nr:helix-turn-helix domain-containing protein [Fluoribacter gormanii]
MPGYTQQQIADEIGVHKSTISRELNRNITFIRTRLGFWTYKASNAQTYADERKRNKPKHVKANERLKIVDEKARVGDWEIDTIIGKNRKHAIVSLVERKTKFTMHHQMKFLQKKSAP